MPFTDQELPRSEEPKKPIKGLAAIGALAVLALSKFKAIGVLVVSGLKFLKFGKILTTSGSMFVSVWFYSLAFGWKFAFGFVLLIFIHEMGHVFVAWRQGLPISAPIFIPGFGALILLRAEGKSAWNQAVMGIGGPVAGSLGALVCWWLYTTTQNELFLGLAYIGFMLNLFNLIPVFPLDGGWITGAVSPYIWLIGIVGIVGGFFTGYIRNPLIFVLLLTSLPRLWRGIKTGVAHGPDIEPARLDQKLKMGLAYVLLAGALAWAQGETHKDWTPERQNQYFDRGA